MSWLEVPFESIVTHSAFGPRFSGDCYAEEGNVATMRTTDLSADGVISLSTMPEADLDEARFSDHFLKPGDLVISRSGRIGTTAVFTGYHKPVLPGAFLIRFRLDESKAAPLFYRYFFNSQYGQQKLLSVARGAAQQNINITNVRALSVPLPPLEVQNNIADRLASFDDLIDNNRRRIALLEQSARLLYREWFVHLRFPGHEHVKAVDGVPEGWEKRPLADLVSPQYGYTETASADEVGPKFLRGTDINKTSFIDWSRVPYCPIDDQQMKKYRLRPRDIVVIRMADPGKVGIVEDDVEAVFASYLIRLNLKSDNVEPYYLFYALESPEYQGFISGSSTGATRKTANAALITSFGLRLPPLALQDEFAALVRPLRDQLTALLKYNAKLRQARDLLLPRLMRGEIEV